MKDAHVNCAVVVAGGDVPAHEAQALGDGVEHVLALGHLGASALRGGARPSVPSVWRDWKQRN